LLHGRSGTGKSSFLRAGLYARALKGNRTFYVIAEDGEPCFVRSTANPISALSDALLARVDNQDYFPGASAQTRHDVRIKLSSARNESPVDQARALRSALSLLTEKLPGTLVLVVDQAEEVFTLTSPNGPDIRKAYFELLEDLCFQPFDIKLVITLRTEYYGQFVDRFRVPPNLNITPVVSGIDQFMLNGIQDPARLQTAIERPSLARWSGAPQGYGFEFEPGLARQIADDLAAHCKESSALPVLQIVCSQLFQDLPKKQTPGSPPRRITKDAYRTLGGVSGAIERYIEKAIANALRECGKHVTPRRLDGWKHIISALVARQEGGALTSLLLSVDALKERAREARVVMELDGCLEALAGDRLRLLRSERLRDPEARRVVAHYSLAHDALASSLFRWQETRGKQIEDAAKTRAQAHFWMGLSAAAAALVFLGGCLVAAFLAINAQTLALRATRSAIES
jgi:hypothetical protein